MENFDKSYHDKTGDVLGALSYLSVFFAPVLFPLIVWIVDNHQHLRIQEMHYLTIF